MESKLLVGGKSIIDKTTEQERALEERRQQIAEQQVWASLERQSGWSVTVKCVWQRNEPLKEATPQTEVVREPVKAKSRKCHENIVIVPLGIAKIVGKEINAEWRTWEKIARELSSRPFFARIPFVVFPSLLYESLEQATLRKVQFLDPQWRSLECVRRGLCYILSRMHELVSGAEWLA